MKRSDRKYAIALFVVCMLAAYSVASYLYYIKTPIGLGKERLVEVRKNDTAARVVGRLVDEGIVTNASYFKIMVRLKGGDRTILNGYYLVRKEDSPQTFWERVLSGEVERYKVAVPEGYTVAQIADVIERQGIGTAERFIALAGDRKFIRKLGLAAPALEGYLFPATYYFDPVTKEEDAIREMTGKMKTVLHDELGIPRETPGKEIQRILTLASLVEKETRVKDEMPLIAAVFLNRLKKGMKLQCDPTVMYGLKKFDGRLTKQDLQTPNPYNTYVRYGLPPTPIANPSKEAVHSVLHPGRTDYLYFVAKNDGTHFFSASLAEHNKAVWMYQKKKKKKGDA